MVNPASIMKIMNLKNKFAANHPKFVSFINYCLNGGIQEGTVIENCDKARRTAGNF